MVEIESKVWSDGIWTVVATITLADGTRSGPHRVFLPENASDDTIKAAILTLYA